MREELLKNIRKFYDRIENDRAQYFEGCLMEIDDDGAHLRHGLCPDYKLRQALIWCDYEEIPSFVADLFILADIDIEDVLTDLLNEQRELDREATEDYEERQREYRELQGWHV